MQTNAMLERTRLLLVDDDPLISATLGSVLDRAGFDITVATAASEALELVARRPFALAILDYAMPESSGLELAQHFAGVGQPFMFLTAYGDQDLVCRAAGAGALAYLVKPVDPNQLVPAVRAAIGRHDALRH